MMMSSLFIIFGPKRRETGQPSAIIMLHAACRGKFQDECTHTAPHQTFIAFSIIDVMFEASCLKYLASESLYKGWCIGATIAHKVVYKNIQIAWATISQTFPNRETPWIKCQWMQHILYQVPKSAISLKRVSICCFQVYLRRHHNHQITKRNRF